MRKFAILLIVFSSIQFLVCTDESLLRHKILRTEELVGTTFDYWFSSRSEHVEYLQNITRYPVSAKIHVFHFA